MRWEITGKEKVDGDKTELSEERVGMEGGERESEG
jgi:hypothetical protein